MEPAPISDVHHDRLPLLAWVARAPFGLCVLDAELRFVAVNRALCALDGVDPAAHEGRTLGEVICEPPTEVLAMLRRALDLGEIEVARDIVVRTPERARCFTMTCFPLELDAVRRGVGVAVHEVTARYEAEARLSTRAALAADHARLTQAELRARRRAEATMARLQRLEALTASLAEVSTRAEAAAHLVEHALAACGAQRGLLASASEDGAALELLAGVGLTRGEACARVPIGADAALTEAFRSREPAAFATMAAHRARHAEAPPIDGATSLAVIPIILSERRCLGAVALGFDAARDLDEDELAFLVAVGRQGAQALERARLVEAEQRARALAEEAGRAKDEFLAVVSHELRTPLHAILGWSALLHGKPQADSLVAKALGVIERNARAQARIIDDILDVSQIVSGRLLLDLRPVPVEPALCAAAEVVRPSAASKGVTLALRVGEDVPLVAGDPERLQQIFWNLLANAVKFTLPGGHVEAALSARDGAVVATVLDTGIGIDRAFLPFVFDRFRQSDATTSRSHGGLGLGLAVVRHLVELHGGEVRAESDGPGHGARFSVTLPIARG